MIHQSSLELVGGTPLLQLNNWMRLLSLIHISEPRD